MTQLRVRVQAGDTQGLTARRVRASLGTGGFDGAKSARRLSSWRPTREHLNSLLVFGGETLLARAREQVRNNPYAASASASFAANVVGCGIKPSSLVEDASAKAAIQAAWLAWTDESDADGLTDFYGQQAIVASALFDAGECFIRFRPRRLSDGLSVPLQLQLIEAEQLPLTKIEPTPSGNVIRAGIEFDRIGRRVAYHFYRRHPADSTDLSGIGGETVRVPASEVLHLYKPLRPGQIRGVPWISPVLVKMFMLDQYDDAELDRKKTAALFAGFITKPTPEDSLIGEGEAEEDGTALAGLQPGTMQVLLPGEDVKFSDPAEVGGSYEPFQYRNLVAMCAGMGLPYQNVTGDVLKANYSNIRAGLVEVRRRLEQLQHEVFVFQLCRPVWRRWMADAVMSGALDLPGFARAPAPWLRAKFIPPKWDWVDPLKDQQAEKLAVRSGFKARADVIDAQGYDPEETDARIAADNARADDRGLVFDSDPRQRTNTGASTDSGAAPGEREDDDEQRATEDEDEDEDEVAERRRTA